MSLTKTILRDALYNDLAQEDTVITDAETDAGGRPVGIAHADLYLILSGHIGDKSRGPILLAAYDRFAILGFASHFPGKLESVVFGITAQPGVDRYHLTDCRTGS